MNLNRKASTAPHNDNICNYNFVNDRYSLILILHSLYWPNLPKVSRIPSVPSLENTYFLFFGVPGSRGRLSVIFVGIIHLKTVVLYYITIIYNDYSFLIL